MNTITAIMPEFDTFHLDYHRGKHRFTINLWEGAFTAHVWTNPKGQRHLWNQHVVTFRESDLQRLLDTLIAWETDSVKTTRKDAA